jgi:hypothetical protein
LKFNGGNPVISYRDLTLGDLKLATCTANCASASPSWVITTIDSAGDTGRYTSLQFRDGKPVVSYYDVTNGRVKLATCTADCATGAATWIITVVDEAPFRGRLAILDAAQQQRQSRDQLPRPTAQCVEDCDVHCGVRDRVARLDDRDRGVELRSPGPDRTLELVAASKRPSRDRLLGRSS